MLAHTPPIPVLVPYKVLARIRIAYRYEYGMDEADEADEAHSETRNRAPCLGEQ